ncbi:MAG TPA: DUF1015 domain-containing protein [Vicinamibacteria bacterium]|nr:DUF1015 domain-containing protein [Vicinamibacteria bacterium]
MPEIQPFPGVFYRVPETDLPRVLAPPYDVITPDYQAQLYDRDPRNIVRVVLNRNPGDAAYDDAGLTFRRWQQEGVLAPDPEPALYLLEQRFEVGGRTLIRVGLLARFRAVNPEARVVLPHEHTRQGPKEDRYRLLKATRANFSPIFLMFGDRDRRFAALAAELMTGAPATSFLDDGGVGHRLWRVTQRDAIVRLAEALAGQAYIADGHHRYATALRYRDQAGPDGALTLGYFTPLNGPGLLVQPYHRILSSGPTLAEAGKALAGHFDLRDAPDAATAAREVEASAAPYVFALAEPGRGALVVEAGPGARSLLPPDAPPSLAALDTYFFHQAVLTPTLGVPAEAVSYVHSLGEAVAAVEQRRCRLAVLMRSTPVRQVVDVAEAGESMPAKSTFFHPKLPSGLVIHPLVG